MSNRRLTLLVKDYGRVAPLAADDVRAAGIDLELIRDNIGALDVTLSDSSIDAGELSFGRHLLRLAEGDDSFVGIPSFVTRAFRHRCFFARRDSGMTSLGDLAGTRVGTNEWPATGNTWSRGALREAGVVLESINWCVGSVDGSQSQRPQGNLPANAQAAEPGRGLVSMLLANELDALMIPNPPPGFYERDSPVTRLLPDYRGAEQAYFRRTGVFPIHHIVGVRREVFQRDPWIVRSLFDALDASRRQWQHNSRLLLDASPWLLADLEEADEAMGENWAADGVEGNQRTIKSLIDEQVAQGLTRNRLDADAVFAEFQSAPRLLDS